MNTSNATAKKVTVGRTDRNHLEVINNENGGLKIAVLDRDDVLKAFVYMGPGMLSHEPGLIGRRPPSNEDGARGYVIHRVDGYCRHGDPIDIHGTVINLLSVDRFYRLLVAQR